MITIKPHHFIDIVKLYGAGIERFVPDKAFGHDFYRVANEIVGDVDTALRLTVYADDICKPCNRYDGKKCTDPLNSIEGFCSKETYNRELDTRLLGLLQLSTEESYTARELMLGLQQNKDIIFLAWKEEKSELVEKRNALFQMGCAKLLAGVDRLLV